MAGLSVLIGKESDLAAVTAVLRQVAQDSRAAVVGAHYVCCSDETEREAAEAFERGFVGPLLPMLKFGHRGAFHTANLGARYETGSLHIAEEHYTAGGSESSSTLVVLKINSHVGVRTTGDQPEYGVISRYGCDSTCCGALGAMFAGGQLPAIKELRQLFDDHGTNRSETLSDPEVVPPEYRDLWASVANAWLQARCAVEDISRRASESPTMFLVLPCVTINRAGEADTEVVVGQYAIDCSGETPEIRYQGLGGDPARYRAAYEEGRLIVDEA